MIGRFRSPLSLDELMWPHFKISLQSSTPKSRTSTRSTPKSDGPSTRTRRLTSNESTSKYTQSRESSVERVLEDKRTRSRSYEPKSSQIQLKIQRDQIDDGELTLDDLETKFSIDDIDVNPIVNPSEVNNLSLSLNSKRQIGLNFEYFGKKPFFLGWLMLLEPISVIKK